ncbi:transient receptor potential cation channel subfamily M member 8-like isoform X2 [Clytia hemisphaerica]|uniref:transient receptor potential cation channel subfamily M member 8-like isoform X2 n=1 Tax=Clytia hemisphaerica TaxID=252671 RepID=UPI0034D54000
MVADEDAKAQETRLLHHDGKTEGYKGFEMTEKTKKNEPHDGMIYGGENRALFTPSSNDNTPPSVKSQKVETLGESPLPDVNIKQSSNTSSTSNDQLNDSNSVQNKKYENPSPHLPFKIYNVQAERQRHEQNDSTDSNSKDPEKNTDAYGHVVFVGGEQTLYAKYLRLRDDTDFNKDTGFFEENLQQIGQKLKNILDIDKTPRLIVSINGGFLEDEFEPAEINQKEKNFQNDLNKFCKTVAESKKETLFITGGMDTKIIEMMDEAMKAHKNQSINTIGIMKWNDVHQNDKLTQKNKRILVPKYPPESDDDDSDFEDFEERASVVDESNNFITSVRKEGILRTHHLNKSHSHFLFVDTIDPNHDSVHKFRNSFEDYLIKPQRKASNKKENAYNEDSSEDVPSVQILLNGGIRSMNLMKRTLNWDNLDQAPLMPIIFVKDSGRLSTCLSLAWKISTTKGENEWTAENNKELEDLIGKQFVNHKSSAFVGAIEDYTDEERKAIFKFVKSCSTLPKLKKFIFEYDTTMNFPGDMKENERTLQAAARKVSRISLPEIKQFGHLQNVIVNALLKFHKRKKKEDEDRDRSYYKLMMVWDTFDTFKTKVDELFEDKEKNLTLITNIMHSALKTERPKFFQYLLSKDYEIQDLLDWKEIAKLYCEVLSNPEEDLLAPFKFYQGKYKNFLIRWTNKFIRKCTEGSGGIINFKDALQNIHFFEKQLKEKSKKASEWRKEKHFYDEVDKVMEHIKSLINDLSTVKICRYKSIAERIRKENMDNEKSEYQKIAYDPKKEFKPYKELYIWSILCNKPKIADYLKRRGENPIAKLLVGCKLYQNIKHLYKTKVDKNRAIVRQLDSIISKNESEAIEILDTCSNVDKISAGKLVSTPLPQYGNKTLMELAALSGRKNFVGNNRCKREIDKRWRNNIRIQDGDWLNMLVLLGIFLFPIAPYIVTIRTKKHDPTKERKTGCCHTCCRYCGWGKWWKKLVLFIQAPVTKYWTNNMSFLCFIGFFIYVILNPFPEDPRKSEWFLLAYIIALTMEEIRQMLLEDGLTIKQKTVRWWQNNWNKIDFVACTIFYLAFIMRITIPFDSARFEYCRFVYAFDIFLWIFRILEMFIIHEMIGKYIIMMLKMVKDVFYLVVIFVVLVCAWGVARFSILYPQNTFDVTSGTSTEKMFKKMLIVPFFQIFGELYVESMENSLRDNLTVFGTKYSQDKEGNLRAHGEFETFLLVLTFAYMVLTNILLINMLIAKFNDTFSEVNQQSLVIWHWYNFIFVQEHDRRSVLPIPFSIFGHFKVAILEIIKKINKQTRKCQTDCCKSEKRYKGLNKYFSKHENYLKIINHENDCYAMWKTRIIEEEKKHKNEEELVRTIKKTILEMRQGNNVSFAVTDNQLETSKL